MLNQGNLRNNYKTNFKTNYLNNIIYRCNNSKIKDSINKALIKLI